MMDFSKLIMYIPGIIIFLVGSGQVRDWIRMHRGGICLDAEVLSCQHVVKKDKKGRETFNYYNVVVEYLNPETKHKERQAIKSPVEYVVAQSVKMYRDRNAASPVLAENREELLFHPWVMMIGGALLIVLALEENKGQEIPAMMCLAVILAGAGLNLIIDYIILKKKNLQVLDAEIIDIFSRQISKETKIIRGSKFTSYPIVKYELNGQENRRRCNINSSGNNAFQVGEHMNLYYDPEKRVVLEKHARPWMLIIGIVVLAIGVLAGASILSVL